MCVCFFAASQRRLRSLTGGGEHQELAGASRQAGPGLGAKLPGKDDGGGEQVSDPQQSWAGI